MADKANLRAWALAADGRVRAGIEALPPPLRDVVRHPVTLVVSVALLLCLPALAFGYSNGIDSHFALVWHANFSAQLWGGEWYPRWLRDVAWGLGGPVFFYYPPLGYFASALAQAAVPGTEAWRALGLASTAGLLLSGLTAYLWARTMAGGRAAALAAVLYMALPYHVAIDLYIRSAYAEYWSFAWMPLVLYAIGDMRRDALRATVVLAFAYAALATSHISITLLFSPLAGIYALVLYRRAPARLVGCGIGVLAGMGLAAVYLLPAMSYQDFVSTREYWGLFLYALNPLDYIDKFLHPENEFVNGSTKFLLLRDCSLLLVAYLLRVCWFVRSEAAPEDVRRFNFWLWSSVALLFLVTPLSYFAWELLPLFKKAQYAFRLGAVLCVAAIPVAALGFEATSRLGPDRRSEALAQMAIVVVGAMLIDVASVVHPERFNREVTRERIAAASGVAELLPKEATPPGAGKEDFDIALAKHLMKKWDRAWVVSGQAGFKVVSWEPRRLAIDVDAPAAARLAVGQLYFPFWRASRDGQCCLPLAAMDSTGVLAVDLPPGRYRLDLTLVKPPREIMGERISALTLLILLLATVAVPIRRFRGRSAAA